MCFVWICEQTAIIYLYSFKKKTFRQQLDLNLKKNLLKCYVCSIALRGAGNWTLQTVDQKYIESFEMWCWR